MKILEVKTRAKEEFVDITPLVQKAISEDEVKEGLCIVFIPHTTAGITINENADPDVVRDILYGLRKIVPDNAPYSHGEGNSPAHIKASILGQSEIILVKDGKLALGTWQGIFLCEFDGPRTRKVYVSVHKK
ncbi:MAG: secondary thiamine-phosphate synthase enzyme YjbQ [Acidobacteriota bacterium]